MEQKRKHLHIELTQEQWEMIKIEAIKRGFSVKDFVLGCIGEIIAQDDKYQK